MIRKGRWEANEPEHEQQRVLNATNTSAGKEGRQKAKGPSATTRYRLQSVRRHQQKLQSPELGLKSGDEAHVSTVNSGQ